MNIDVLNIYIKKLKYCIITNKTIRSNITKKTPGINGWLNTFPNAQIMNARSIVHSLKDEVYDIIHIELNKDDIDLIDIIRDKIGKNSYTQIIASFNSLKEDFNILTNKVKTIEKTNFIYCTEDYYAEKLQKIVNRKVYIIEYPENIKWFKSIKKTKKINKYKSKFVNKKFNNMKIYLLKNKDIKEITKDNFNLNFDNFLFQKHDLYKLLNTLNKSKVAIIKNEKNIDNRIIILLACLKIPVIGSNKVDIIRRCYPYTAIDMEDKNQLFESLKKIQNDKYFHKLIKKIAYKNAEYFNWKNSIKRLMFNICIEIGNKRFNNIKTLIKFYQNENPVNTKNVKGQYKNKKLNILGVDIDYYGSLSILNNNKLIYLKKKDNKIFTNLSLIKKIEKAVITSNKNNAPIDLISIVRNYGYQKGYSTIHNFKILNKKINIYQSDFEKALLFNCFGLSPLQHGEPCYILLLNDTNGNFYKIDKDFNIIKYEEIIKNPGFKYILPYIITKNYIDNTIGYYLYIYKKERGSYIEYLKPDEKLNLTKNIINEINFILNSEISLNNMDNLILKFKEFSIFNLGIEDQLFKNFAWELQNKLFEKYYNYAKENLKENLPLIIGGTFGLHSYWNTKWKDSGEFKNVYVSPCPGDAGISLGAAIDAQYHFTKNAKIEWNLYSGDKFETSKTYLKNFNKYDFNLNHISDFILKEKIIVWIQGNNDISENGSCNRSIISGINNTKFKHEINKIKLFDKNTPVSIICPEIVANQYFHWEKFFFNKSIYCKVKDLNFQKKYNIDDQVKIQTILKDENKIMFKLLLCIKEKIGFPIIYSSPVNINKKNEFVSFITEKKLDGMVINNKFYIRK